MKKIFTKNSSYKIIQYSDGPYPDLCYEMAPDYELKEYDVLNADSEEEVLEIIKNNREVDAIVTYSTEDSIKFEYLCEYLSDEFKRKWYHYKDYENHGNELGVLINYQILTYYEIPFFSITTPLYYTNPTYFKYAYESLKNQVFKDWEWVLVDDSAEQLFWVQAYIKELNDPRVKYFRVEPVSDGCIGLTKWRANCFSRGKWLLEFDHDDILPWWSLQEAKNAIDKFPDAGFVSSDDAPIDGNNLFQGYTYGEEYGLGYGYPYNSSEPNHQYDILSNRDSNINSATIRHIVGVPNHFRCWKREVYFKIGGHNTNLRIADDYELLVRTWLETPMIHVNAPCYYQRFDGHNSQDAGTNRADIQRRVRWISNYYNEQIHNKILELGGTEDMYDPNDSFETMHNYYGMPDIQHFNYEYTPEWEDYPFQVTAQQAKEYRESMKNEED